LVFDSHVDSHRRQLAVDMPMPVKGPPSVGVRAEYNPDDAEF
jgi:hypothetical protein